MDQEKNTEEKMSYENGGAQRPSGAGMETGGSDSERASAKKGSFWGKWWVWIILIIFLTLGAYFYTSDSPMEGLQSMFSGGSGNAVAMVNGETIERSEFEARLGQLEQNLQAQAQGSEIPQEQLDAQKEQLLKAMIDTKLVAQAAHEQGLSVSDERVETYYQDSVVASAGSEEALKQQLSGTGFSIPDLKEDIRTQFLVDEYVAQNAEEGELAVSDQELQSFYDQLASGQQGGNVPPLESVRGQLEQQLQRQKQGVVMQRLVQDLRADAEIQTYL